MRLARPLGMVLILGMLSPAVADVYVWRDTAGVRHYTNDLANVPAEFRGKSQVVVKDWVRAGPPQEPTPPSPESTPPPAAPALRNGADSESRRDGEEAEAVVAARTSGSPEPVVLNRVVQNVVGYVEVDPVAREHGERFVAVPVPIGRHAARHGIRERRRDLRSRFPPASRAPFLQGPAGPPPISTR